MSHTVTIETELSNRQVILAACKRLSWRCEENARIRFHDGAAVEGTAVYIPGWRYPIVVTNDGATKGDNYNGAWGDAGLLGRLKQAYGIETAKRELRKHLAPIVEIHNKDGSVTVGVEYEEESVAAEEIIRNLL